MTATVASSGQRRRAATTRELRNAIRRHRPWLVAGLVAAAVAAGLSAVAPAKAAGAPVLVAARDLPAGAVVGARDVAVERIPPVAVPDGALRRRADAAGRMLAGPVRRGEPLTDARLAGPGLLTGLSWTDASAAAGIASVAGGRATTTGRGADGGVARLTPGPVPADSSAARDTAGDVRAGPPDVAMHGTTGVTADGVPPAARDANPGDGPGGRSGIAAGVVVGGRAGGAVGDVVGRADDPWTAGALPSGAGVDVAALSAVVAVPVRLTDVGAASVVAAGDRIDILATPPQGNGPAVIVASDVLVLANLSGGGDPGATSSGLAPPSAADPVADPGDGGLIVVATDTVVAADLARAAVGDQLSPVLRAPPRARAP